VWSVGESMGDFWRADLHARQHGQDACCERGSKQVLQGTDDWLPLYRPLAQAQASARRKVSPGGFILPSQCAGVVPMQARFIGKELRFPRDFEVPLIDLEAICIWDLTGAGGATGILRQGSYKGTAVVLKVVRVCFCQFCQL
jgi:hypothetical protein